jgi:putative ABC transport system substrate-binding protein
MIGNINKKLLISLVAILLLVSTDPAKGQPAGKAPRIGVLFIGGRNQPHLAAFKQGLRERGYTEGKNITLEYRYAEGKEDRLPLLAAELVHLKVDVIVVTADVSAQAAQRATKTTPIVVTTGDPVAWGLADSLAKPGGNVTGLSVLLADLSGKRVEILKEGDLESLGYSPLEADCRAGAQATPAWHVPHETICRRRRLDGLWTPDR